MVIEEETAGLFPLFNSRWSSDLSPEPDLMKELTSHYLLAKMQNSGMLASNSETTNTGPVTI